MELNMYKLAEQLKQLREAKKDAEQRVKDINAEIDKTEYSLVQLMAETETQNFTRAGTMFSLTKPVHPLWQVIRTSCIPL